MGEGIDLERRWKINSVQILQEASKKSVMKLAHSTKMFPCDELNLRHKGRQNASQTMCQKKSVTSQPNWGREKDHKYNLV